MSTWTTMVLVTLFVVASLRAWQLRVRQKLLNLVFSPNKIAALLCWTILPWLRVVFRHKCLISHVYSSIPTWICQKINLFVCPFIKLHWNHLGYVYSKTSMSSWTLDADENTKSHWSGWCTLHNRAESKSKGSEAEGAQLQHRPLQSILQGKRWAQLCSKGSHKDMAPCYAQANAPLRIAMLANQTEELPKKILACHWSKCMWWRNLCRNSTSKTARDVLWVRERFS